MYADDSVDFLLVLLVHLNELLDVPVVRQGELGERQDRSIEFENVHIYWLSRFSLRFLCALGCCSFHCFGRLFR